MSIDQAVALFKTTESETQEWFQKEIASLRSGLVKPNLVENLSVESYGARTPLNGLASVSSSDARTLIISPWDKSVLGAIEKAITEADLGVQPTVEGEVIRLSFPTLTDEVRQKLVRILHNKAEEARVRLRQARDEAIRSLKQQKEKSDLTEDDFFDGKKTLDEMIHKAGGHVDEWVKRKEGEIAAV